MGRLIDDLLDVARVTQGKIVVREQPLAFDQVVRRAVDVARPILEARHHHLALSLPHESLSVLGDPTRLEQMVTNLLQNAAKYTDIGGRIEVRLVRDAECVELTVSDNGIGMSPEILKHAFDLFSQADRSLDRSQGGLGIGLTMVKSIVNLHGGTVTAASDGVGHGSTFTVRLPASTSLPPEAAGELSEAQPDIEPLRVLVVEDNRDTANTLTTLLAHWGHRVRTVYDGAQALAAERDFRPDVVLLDIGLPGIDGYEVAKQLRVQMAGQPLSIVAISGYGREEDKRRAHEAGCDHHLTKPPARDELQSLLQRRTPLH